MTGARAAGIAGAAGLIAVVTLVARVVGFGRWLVFSHSVGSTCVGQVYSTANQMPNTLYEVAAGGALAAVVVPLVAGSLEQGRPAEADRAASAMLTWAVTILLPLAVLLAAVAEPLAAFMLGGSGGCEAGPSHRLAAQMIVIFAPQVLLYGIGITLSGVLQAHRRFFAAALAPLLSSLVMIASYAAYGRLAGGLGDRPGALGAAAVTALAGGTTLGVVALSLPLLLPVRRAGIRLRPTWRFPPGMGRRATHLAGAGVVALAAQQTAVQVAVWLCDHRGQTGTLPVYNYVQAIYQLPYAVLAVPVAMSAFPHLVSRSHRVFVRTLPVVVITGMLGCALLIAVARPATTFFLGLDAGRQQAAGTSVQALGAGVGVYALGLPGFCAAALLLRTVYAAGRSWAGGLVMAAGWLIGAAVPFLMTGRDTRSATRALVALGTGSAIGMTVAAAGLVALVARAWGPAVLLPSLRPLAAALPAAALAAAAGWALNLAPWPGGLIGGGCGAVASALVTALVFAAAIRAWDPATGRRLWGVAAARLPVRAGARS